MKLLNFLYYSVYRVFALIPRKEPIDHILAATFFSLLFSTNLITLLILGKSLGLDYGRYDFRLFLILIFVTIYIIFRWYYIRSGNYKKIIEAGDRRFFLVKYRISMFGIAYLFLTFLGFYLLSTF